MEYQIAETIEFPLGAVAALRPGTGVSCCDFMMAGSAEESISFTGSVTFGTSHFLPRCSNGIRLPVRINPVRVALERKL